MKTGLIYIIVNDINKKVYIGQTTTNMTTRFNQHCKKSTLANRHYKLYNAIKKYGKEHFSIHLLEGGIPLNCLNDREIYYIEKYDSFFNGYNSSKGGDGRTINKKYDEKKIVYMYQNGKSLSEIARKYNVSGATISRALKRLNINTRHDGNKYEGIDQNKFLKMWYDKDVTIEIMAKRFNVDPKTIRRHSKRMGLRRKGYTNMNQKKEMVIVVWEKTKNVYTTKEYVFDFVPPNDEINNIIKDKKMSIMIGLNPSKESGIISDETNMYLKNKIYESGDYDGYVLMNIFSDISTNFVITKEKIDKEYIKRQINVLNFLKDCNVILFYGKNAVKKLNNYIIDEELKGVFDSFNDAINRHAIEFTISEDEFVHPACPGCKSNFSFEKKYDGEWKITGKKNK